MMSGRKSGGKAIPYDKRYKGIKNKAFKKTDKTVEPVAKDKNSTRRKMSNPLIGQKKGKKKHAPKIKMNEC